MGQVNVNTPNDGGGVSGEPTGSSGAGFILGIIVAIIVIAALVYFLVLNPGNGGTDPGNGGTDPGNGATDDGGAVDPTDADVDPTDAGAAPSGWVLVDRA